MKSNDLINIVYNSTIIHCDIPVKHLQWRIDDKLAIEWIAFVYWNKSDLNIRYIINDEILKWKDKSCILRLLIKTINISAKTVEIINSLLEIDWLDKNNFYKFN